MRSRGSLLVADPGVPQEPGGLRQARGVPRCAGLRPCRGPRRRPTSSSSTRVPSSRPPARSRSTPSWTWRNGVATGARLVVTGCMAERYGDELRDALPEVDLVAGFGRDVDRVIRAGDRRCAGRRLHWPEPARRRDARDPPTDGFDLLRAAPPRRPRPVGLREGRRGLRPHLRLLRHPVLPGQAALPLARGDPGRGRRAPRAPGHGGPPLREIVLVAQDLASYGRDRTGPGRRSRTAHGPSPIAALTRAVSARVERTRLLYLYPSGLTDELIEAVLETGVPYFDLSLQHVSRPLLTRMRRWGDGERFLRRIADIRAADPDATFRSSFILGYPGETERDHDLLLEFLEEAQLDWAGFFPFSNEDGHLRRRPRRPGARPSSPSSVCASAPSCRTPSPLPSVTASSVQVRAGARRRARAGPHRARGARDRRRRPRPARPRRSAASSTCVITGAEGPDLRAVPADRPRRGPRRAGAGAATA